MDARQPSGGATIEVRRNGPYLVRGPCRLRDGLGNDVPARGTYALCRCGNSSNKPFCDGTHKKTGFDGARLATEPVGASQPYRGKRITVHDNRAVCSHSGICTDNLSAVFRLGAEPWIDAGGADAEVIGALVARCPSGALSYTIDGQSPPAASGEPVITASKNGPYYVSGPVELSTGGAKPAVAGRYALCRCGASNNKPYCDGTHWAMGFDEGRGLQAGVFLPPGGVRRFSLAFGAVLLAGVTAAVLAIEAAGKWSAPGFLFSGALIPDLNLALQMLLVAGLTFGGWLAKRGNIAAHRYNQTVWVLVNAVLVVLIMARGMDNAAFEAASDLARPHILVPWLHAAIGTATVAAGLWLVAQMNGLLPRRFHVRGWKTLMRVTLAGYWLVALLGIGIYYLWFLR
jgi:CDGSH-type Zn-finger protein/uncharacterized membrane protein YozB (DUF420 family)